MDYFKRHKFDWSKFRLGMRTFKTGIAVFIVLLIFGIFGWRGLQIGTLTAVFSLRKTLIRVSTSGLRVSWATVSEVLCRIVLPFKNALSWGVLGDSYFCTHCDHVNHYDKCRYE